jgi:ParB/RepB/Spo0J family partition protein
MARSLRNRSSLKSVPAAPPVPPAALLLPDPVSGTIPLDQIELSPFNKRVFREGDPRDLELLQNLQALRKIVVPILLRPDGDRYRLIAGERRVRFGREAGILEAPALVYDVDEATANLLTFAENRYRSDLHYLEEADAVSGLLISGCTQEMIAAQLGTSIKWVALRARLTNLSAKWREILADPGCAVHHWSASHMEVIALLSQEAQDDLLLDHHYLLDSVPTMAELRSVVSQQTLQLAGSPWRLDDDTLCPQAGACSTCPSRSSFQPVLFTDFDGESTSPPKDRCLNRLCWEAKLEAHLVRKEQELRQVHPGLLLLTARGSSPRPDVIPAWKTLPAKKKQSGAVPAFVLDGADRGTLRWVFPPDASTEPVPPASALPLASPAAPVPGQRAKSSLAEREAALNRRRMLLATERIQVAVKEATQIPPIETVLALTYVFGTQQTLGSGAYCSDGLLQDRIVEDLSGSAAPLGDLHPGLWQRVLPVLLARTSLDSGRPDDTLRAYREACRLASLVGVDSEEHMAAAIATLPDPASWTAERAAMVRAAAIPGLAEGSEPIEEDGLSRHPEASFTEASDRQEAAA